MAGPEGNFDEIIMQLLQQQQQQGQMPQEGQPYLPGRTRMPMEIPLPNEEGMMSPDQAPMQMAGAADVYNYGNGMGGQAGMPTPQQAINSEADRLQAIKLQQALKALRAGRG